jgi:hypothetical protein|tara:strand:- start:43 stop:297 length:255 start_codon:yes stop_codon:yes gene_type:complete
MTKDQEIIRKIKSWLEYTVQDVEDIDELDDISKGWLECSENLLEQINKWVGNIEEEKTYVEPYGNTGSDSDYFHPKAKTTKGRN